jgi:hypothetical protein
LMTGAKTVLNAAEYRYGTGSDSLNGMSVSTPLHAGGPLPLGCETVANGAASDATEGWYY